jgi:intracellular multiplication protein IcmQ
MESEEMSLAAFSTTDVQHFKNDEQKYQLMNCLSEEKERFKKLAESYYTPVGSNDENYYQMCEEIIKTVDRVVASCDCENSLFLRSTVKPLRQLRQQAILTLEAAGRVVKDFQLPKIEVNAETQLVYISLFQSKGLELSQWELQLRSITSHVIGRPAYAEEEQVKKVLRQKLQQHNEAYIVVAIPKIKINMHAHLPERRDHFGNVLLHLAANAVQVENIIEFVHQGVRYHFYKNKLIAQKSGG